MHAIFRFFSHILIGLMTGFICIGILFIVFIKDPVPFSKLLKPQFERQLAKIAPEDTVSIGNVEIITKDADETGLRLEVSDIRFFDKQGQQNAYIPKIKSQFSVSNAFLGKFGPTEIEIVGASVGAKRTSDGMYELAIGSFTTDDNKKSVSNFKSLSDFLNLLERPNLDQLKQVRLKNAKVKFNDQLSKREFDLNVEEISIERDGNDFDAIISASIDNKTETITELFFSAILISDSNQILLRANFENAHPVDIADQIPVLDWLKRFDTPASGAMTAILDSDGRPKNFAGDISMSSGYIQAQDGVKPIKFDSANAGFTYNVANKKFNFSKLNLKTSALMFEATGNAIVALSDTRKTQSMTGKLEISNITIDPPEVFEAPILIDSGSLGFHIESDPLIIKINDFTAKQDSFTVHADATIEPVDDRWAFELTGHSDLISSKRVKTYWPLNVATKTRNWVVANVHQGVMKNIKFMASQTALDEKPKFDVSWDFFDGEVTPIKNFPRMRGLNGSASIKETVFTAHANSGSIKPKGLSSVNLSGTKFTVTNLRKKPAPAIANIKASGNIQSILTLLDIKPLSLLSKAGKRPNLATGNATGTADLNFVMKKKLTPNEMKYNVSATLSSVSSSKLIPRRRLTAKKLSLEASNALTTIQGKVALNGITMDAKWAQNSKERRNKQAKIKASLPLNTKTMKSFGVVLPAGTVKNTATGHVEISTKKGASSSFKLTSDLRGMTLSIPQINWSKSASKSGKLSVTGKLGPRVLVDNISLSAAGLSANGSLSISKSGKFQKAHFKTLKISPWLNSSATITPRSSRGMDIVLNGGTIDYRRIKFNSGSRKSKSNTNISLAVNKFIFTDSIVFNKLRANISTRGGVNGKFSGYVNGKAPISGIVSPAKYGTAVQLQSNNAGQLLKASRFYNSAYDGSLVLKLIPLKQAGAYQGHVDMKNFRVKDAPPLAELMSFVSVVGLLSRLERGGIRFREADADFILTPKYINIKQGSAVGASMGISATGKLYIGSKKLDIQGVFTPIYFLNGAFEKIPILGKLLGDKKGEGLIGFNYNMRGSTTNPRISANPLSILTPGAFRRIFRKPVPK